MKFFKVFLIALFAYSGLLFADQSTVIGRRADSIITRYAVHNAGTMVSWPLELLSYVDLTLLMDDPADGDLEVGNTEIQDKFCELENALRNRDWEQAVNSRMDLEDLLEHHHPDAEVSISPKGMDGTAGARLEFEECPSSNAHEIP